MGRIRALKYKALSIYFFYFTIFHIIRDMTDHTFFYKVYVNTIIC